jgi:hypothetical protein
LAERAAATVTWNIGQRWRCLIYITLSTWQNPWMKATRELEKVFRNSFLFFCLYSLKMKLSYHESMTLCTLYTRTPVISRWECILSIRNSAPRPFLRKLLLSLYSQVAGEPLLLLIDEL